MRNRAIFLMLLLLSAAAYANPVVFDPVGSIASLVVLLSAVAIEAGIVTLVLLFWGTEPTPLYGAVAAGNLVIYFVAFRPLLDSTNLTTAELVIVALDGVLIKILTRYDTFRDESFRPLKWPWAFVIAAVGNLVSYYVGAVAAA